MRKHLKASKYDDLAKSPIVVILNPSLVILSEAKDLGSWLRVNSVKDLQLFDWVRFFASLRMTGSPLVHVLRDYHF
jgi:hypothetical protein